MPQYLLFVLLLATTTTFAQVDYRAVSLEYGPYTVGYKNSELTDATRSYTRIMQYGERAARPVSVSIWEPAQRKECSEPLTIRNYLEVLRNEEEWPNLPFEYFFDWFYVPGTEHNLRQANYSTQAISCYEAVSTDLPVIIYSASYRASSTENFILCEYLASHGYRVVAIPSKGPANLHFTAKAGENLLAQSRDVDFVISRLGKEFFTADAEVILAGFSFGGLSHILNAANNHRVSGVISLDGTIKYRPELLDGFPQFNTKDFTVPFVHFSQQDIPAAMLVREGLDTAINHDFLFYDSISSPLKYQLKVPHLSHQYFAAYSLLFREREPEQDPEYAVIQQAHEQLIKMVHAALRHVMVSTPNKQTQAFDREMAAAGYTIVSAVNERRESLDFPTFLRLAAPEQYALVDLVYDSLRQKHPTFRPAEEDLNTLALQLVFSSASYQAGINLFRFALRLYPDSANLYDSLAEGYRFHGARTLAKEAFLKSLALNPENANARKRLKDLRE